MAVAEGTRLPGRPQLAQAPAERRKVRPIKWWAAIGAGFLLLEAFIIGKWIISGHAKTTPDGLTPIPGWMKSVALWWQIAGVIALGGFIYYLIIRPWRRERRVTLDGLLTIAFLLLYWQDPLVNYTQAHFTYSTAFLNYGSWAAEIPGWLSPNGSKFAEPVVWSGAAYVYAIFGVIMLGSWLMRKIKARWPQISNTQLVLAIFAIYVLNDIFQELVFMRLGFWAYPGAIRGLTIFRGHYYQFPMTEGFLWGGACTAFACLRYFRDDKGQTIAERGIDEVRATSRQRVGLRFLALFGILNVLLIGVYNVPYQLVGMHADSWPADIVNRSYLTDQLCGPETDRACSSPLNPIPRRGSAHLNPDGDLVKPGDRSDESTNPTDK